MSIKANTIKPGDLVTHKIKGAYRSRSVHKVGDNYVTVLVSGGEIKIPEHQITSHTRRDNNTLHGKNFRKWEITP